METQLKLFSKQATIDRIKKYVQGSIDKDKANNIRYKRHSEGDG